MPEIEPYGDTPPPEVEEEPRDKHSQRPPEPDEDFLIPGGALGYLLCVLGDAITEPLACMYKMGKSRETQILR